MKERGRERGGGGEGEGACTFMNAEYEEEISDAAQEQRRVGGKKVLTRSVDTSSNWD